MTPRADLWARLVLAAAGIDGRTADPSALCVGCVELLGVDGAGITLMSAGGAVAAGYASDAAALSLEELQSTVGDGPIADAYSGGVPVVEPDLGGAGARRWAGFSRGAVAAGICAVFSFPLQVGAARLGVFTLYRTIPGALDGATHSDAVVVAELITRMMLAWQADAPHGRLATELADDGVYQAGVHQATGRISAQLDIGIGEALALLRARSFADSRPIAEIAAEINGGVLRFKA